MYFITKFIDHRAATSKPFHDVLPVYPTIRDTQNWERPQRCNQDSDVFDQVAFAACNDCGDNRSNPPKRQGDVQSAVPMEKDIEKICTADNIRIDSCDHS